jgi:hypothetical protein
MFDTLQSLYQAVIARVLVCRICLARRLISLQTCHCAFQAGQAMFDLANIVLDAGDVGADCPQVLQNKIIYGFRHGHASQWAVGTNCAVRQVGSDGPR